MNKRLLIATLLVATLTSCGGGSDKSSAPQEIKFITEAITSGNLPIILQYSPFVGLDYVNEETLEQLLLDNSDCSIGCLYEYGEAPKSYTTAEKGYTVTMTDGFATDVIYTSYGESFIWYEPSLLAQSIQIYALPDAEVYVNDADISAYLQDFVEDAPEGVDVYNLMIVPNTDLSVTVINPNGSTVTSVIDDSVRESGILDLSQSSFDIAKIEKDLKDLTSKFYKYTSDTAYTEEDAKKLFDASVSRNTVSKYFKDARGNCKLDNAFTKYFNIKIEKLEIIDGPSVSDDGSFGMTIKIITTWDMGDGSLHGREEHKTFLSLIENSSGKYLFGEIDNPEFLTSLNYLSVVDE